MALHAPSRDGRVVDGAVEREVELHVPLEPVELGAATADAPLEIGRVRDVVGDRVPVAGRCLGGGPVGPELGQRAGEVAAAHAVRLVRRARDRVAARSPAPSFVPSVLSPRARGLMSIVDAVRGSSWLL